MYTDSETYAFIDECGDANLETSKEGVSTYYVLTAIIVKEDKLQSLSKKIEELKKFYFQTGEMKSSTVGNNRIRRAKILTAFSKLDFSFYSLCVHKERILKDSGLKYKKSFYKYLNGRLYHLLYKNFLNLHIKADELGREDFMLSFKKYIDVNHKPDLLFKSSFDFVNSRDEILVQLADFISGTINKIYLENKTDELSEAYLDFISSDNALEVDEWPTKFTTYAQNEEASDEFNKLIYQLALSKAEIFINENLNSHDVDIKMQIAFLRHIVFQSKMINRNKYITTLKIRTFLSESGFGDVTQHAVRSKIVGPLRDLDILITSSNKGYKIPCSFNDMQEFVDRVQSIVIPLLNRLSRARNSIKIASENEIDILKGPNYPSLVKFLDEIEKKT